MTRAKRQKAVTLAEVAAHVAVDPGPAAVAAREEIAAYDTLTAHGRCAFHVAVMREFEAKIAPGGYSDEAHTSLHFIAGHALRAFVALLEWAGEPSEAVDPLRVIDPATGHTLGCMCFGCAPMNDDAGGDVVVSDEAFAEPEAMLETPPPIPAWVRDAVNADDHAALAYHSSRGEAMAGRRRTAKPVALLDVILATLELHASACLDDEQERQVIAVAVLAAITATPQATLIRAALGDDPRCYVVRVAGANGRDQERLHAASAYFAGLTL